LNLPIGLHHDRPEHGLSQASWNWSHPIDVVPEHLSRHSLNLMITQCGLEKEVNGKLHLMSVGKPPPKRSLLQ
jgi:hypothetical protein